MSILRIAAGRAATRPVVVATSSVSLTNGSTLHSAATSDEMIDILEPVSSQKYFCLPFICTGITGVPAAETLSGTTTLPVGNVSVLAGTFLNAIAQSSTLALSVSV